MNKEMFPDIYSWVFDLDNTLYPPCSRVLDQIWLRMGSFLVRNLGLNSQDADRLNTRYHQEYGSLLAGLMQNHGTPPEPYLTEIHDIDLVGVKRNVELARAVAALPGKKLVFTNGSRQHACRVLEAIGLTNCIDDIYAIEDVDYAPKPQVLAYDTLIQKSGISPQACAYFDDNEKNLEYPMLIGMRTVWVRSTQPKTTSRHYSTHDLTEFLNQILLGGGTPVWDQS